jgi:hypothetical protein
LRPISVPGIPSAVRARKKRSVTKPSSSAGMPTPLSSTLMGRRLLSDARELTTIRMAVLAPPQPFLPPTRRQDRADGLMGMMERRKARNAPSPCRCRLSRSCIRGSYSTMYMPEDTSTKSTLSLRTLFKDDPDIAEPQRILGPLHSDSPSRAAAWQHGFLISPGTKQNLVYAYCVNHNAQYA